MERKEKVAGGGAEAKEKVAGGGAEGGGQPNVLCVSPEIRAGRTETRKISFSKSMICVGMLVCFRRAAENGCIMHLCVGCCSSLVLHVLELSWKVMSSI